VKVSNPSRVGHTGHIEVADSDAAAPVGHVQTLNSRSRPGPVARHRWLLAKHVQPHSTNCIGLSQARLFRRLIRRNMIGEIVDFSDDGGVAAN
jgi:hypothetical protein